MGRVWLCAAVLLAAPWASAEDAALRAAIDAAVSENAPYRNAMYLYLRGAGVVWIAVEWVAALVLWRAYRMLRAAARRAGHA